MTAHPVSMPREGAAPAAPSRRSEFLRGVRTASPLLLGLAPVALAFGALAVQKGLMPLEVPLMTGLNFAGGSEFAAIGLWATVPPVALIVAVTFLINSRHLLMGAALTPYLAGLSRFRAFAVLALMCDESWAIGLSDARRRRDAGIEPALSLPFYLGQASSFWLMWTPLTFAGALVGPVLGDLDGYAVDMALPAVFIVLLRGMWPGACKAWPWVVSLSAAIAAWHLLPGAWYVPIGASTGLALVWLTAGRA